MSRLGSELVGSDLSKEALSSPFVDATGRSPLLELGLNADFQPLDWGTVIARRTDRNAGDWSTFSAALDGMPINNAGSNFALRGSSAKPGPAGRMMRSGSPCARPGSTRLT